MELTDLGLGEIHPNYPPLSTVYTVLITNAGRRVSDGVNVDERRNSAIVIRVHLAIG